MEPFEKILVLNNQFEASHMKDILTAKDIPHGIVSSADSVFGGVNRIEFGWGYLEAPPQYRDEILKIYDEVENE